MNVEFTTPLDEKRGTIASLLKQSYADVVQSDRSLWEPEQLNWEQYDHDVNRLREGHRLTNGFTRRHTRRA
jgi:hypothetical protein